MREVHKPSLNEQLRNETDPVLMKQWTIISEQKASLSIGNNANNWYKGSYDIAFAIINDEMIKNEHQMTKWLQQYEEESAALTDVLGEYDAGESGRLSGAGLHNCLMRALTLIHIHGLYTGHLRPVGRPAERTQWFTGDLELYAVWQEVTGLKLCIQSMQLCCPWKIWYLQTDTNNELYK